MNMYQNMTSGAGILKNSYKGGGPISQINDKHPEIHAIRKRRDLAAKTQSMK